MQGMSWRGHVPDPCRPLLNYQGGLDDGGRRWVNHHMRRARILAAARELMTACGFDGVHLQTVAETSGVSIQTIYNLVGNRTLMMESASAEWVISIAAAARERARRERLNGAFALIEGFWNAPLLHLDYVKSAVPVSCSRSTPLNRPYLRAGIAAMSGELNRLEARGALRPTIDVPCLARLLTESIVAAICNWTLDPYDFRQFRRELAYGPALTLLGALQGPERARLETVLDTLDRE